MLSFRCGTLWLVSIGLIFASLPVWGQLVIKGQTLPYSDSWGEHPTWVYCSCSTETQVKFRVTEIPRSGGVDISIDGEPWREVERRVYTARHAIQLRGRKSIEWEMTVIPPRTGMTLDRTRDEVVLAEYSGTYKLLGNRWNPSSEMAVFVLVVKGTPKFLFLGTCGVLGPCYLQLGHGHAVYVDWRASPLASEDRPCLQTSGLYLDLHRTDKVTATMYVFR